MSTVTKSTLSGENEVMQQFVDRNVARTYFDTLVAKYVVNFGYDVKFSEENCVVFQVPSPAWDQIELRLEQS